MKGVIKSASISRRGNTKDGKPYVIVKVVLETNERGDIWASSEQEANEYMVAGKEIEYEYVPNSNPQYDGQFKIKKQNKFGAGGGGGISQAKATIAVAAYQTAMQLFAEGKINKDQIESAAIKAAQTMAAVYKAIEI